MCRGWSSVARDMATIDEMSAGRENDVVGVGCNPPMSGCELCGRVLAGSGVYAWRMASEHSKARGVRTRRVPPPPVVRDRVETQRLEDPTPAASKSKRRQRGGSTIDVSEVDFPGVSDDTASKLRRRLTEAATAFERERFKEAESILVGIDRMSPDVPEVNELLGLSYYRQGQWGRAVKRLQSFAERTGSVEQHPTLADSHRALRHWDIVEELWQELGSVSPSPELVEEGRIVAAGALADRGRLRDAVRMLEQAPKAPRKPKPHHLRRWYALADLYERAGDTVRARRLFGEISEIAPDFGDAGARARQLR